MTALLLGGTSIAYIDRLNVAVAAPLIMKELGVGKAEFGWVFSAFLVGYAVLLYLGGLLADRWSPRKMLAMAVAGFSVATLLTPLLAHSLLALVFMRFLVGLLEGPVFPAVTSFNTRWFPQSDYGRAQTLALSGQMIGPIIAFPLTAWLIHRSSWQAAFVVQGLIGLSWAALWSWLAHDTPEDHPHADAQERAAVGAQPVGPQLRVSLREVLASKPLLLLYCSYMLLLFVVWLVIFWMPTYFGERWGWSLAEVSGVGVGLYLAALTGNVGGGMLSDRLVRRGWSAQLARSRSGAIGLALTVPLLCLVAYAPSAFMSAAWMVLVFFFASVALAGYVTLCAEVNRPLAGTLFGMMSTWGATAAIFGPLAGGYLAEGGDWPSAFLTCATGAALAAAMLFALGRRPIRIEFQASATRGAHTGGLSGDQQFR